jgi:hypothetical protein
MPLPQLDIERQKAVAVAQARRRRAEAENDNAPATFAPTLDVQSETGWKPDPVVSAVTARMAPKPQEPVITYPDRPGGGIFGNLSGDVRLMQNGKVVQPSLQDQVDQNVTPYLKRIGNDLGGFAETVTRGAFDGQAQEMGRATGEAVGDWASRATAKPVLGTLEAANAANEMVNPAVPASRALNQYGHAIEEGVSGNFSEAGRRFAEGNVDVGWTALTAAPFIKGGGPRPGSPLRPGDPRLAPQPSPAPVSSVPPTAPRTPQGGAASAGQQPPLNAVPAPPVVPKAQLRQAKDTATILARIMRSGGIKDADVRGYLPGLIQRYKGLNDSRVPLAFFVESDLPQHFPPNVAGDAITKLRAHGRTQFSDTAPKNTSRHTMQDTIKQLRSSQQDEITTAAQKSLYKKSLIGAEDQAVASLKETGRKGYEPVLENARQARAGNAPASPDQIAANKELDALMSDPVMQGYIDDATRIRAKADKIDIDKLIEKDPIEAAHWLQSEFRRLEDAAEDAATGKATRLSTAYSDLRQQLLDPLQRAAPGYEGARRRFGDIYGATQAVKFGRGFFTTAKSAVKTARLGRRFKALSKRQQTVAAMSIRDELLNEFRGTPEDAAAKITKMKAEGTLLALEEVLGAKGKKVADAIRRIEAEAEKLTAIDQYSGPKTFDNTAVAKNAEENIQSPFNKVVGDLGGGRKGWLPAVGIDAGMMASGMSPFPFVTSAKIGSAVVDKFGNPGARVLSNSTEGLYGLPGKNGLVTPPALPAPKGRRGPRVAPPPSQATLDDLLHQFDEAQRAGDQAKGKKLQDQIYALSKQLNIGGNGGPPAIGVNALQKPPRKPPALTGKGRGSGPVKMGFGDDKSALLDWGVPAVGGGAGFAHGNDFNNDGKIDLDERLMTAAGSFALTKGFVPALARDGIAAAKAVKRVASESPIANAGGRWTAKRDGKWWVVRDARGAEIGKTSSQFDRTPEEAIQAVEYRRKLNPPSGSFDEQGFGSKPPNQMGGGKGTDKIAQARQKTVEHGDLEGYKSWVAKYWPNIQPNAAESMFLVEAVNANSLPKMIARLPREAQQKIAALSNEADLAAEFRRQWPLMQSDAAKEGAFKFLRDRPPTQMGGGGGKGPPKEPIIDIYHGTPYEFDRFRSKKIGKGEGNTAFGHGLYFTETENVANHYRDTLVGGDMKLAKVDGEPYNPARADHKVAVFVNSAGSRYGEMGAVKLLSEVAEPDPAVARVVSEILSGARPVPQLRSATGGKVYKAALASSSDELINYDAPLSEQPELVRKALAKLGVVNPAMTGKEIVETYAWTKAASEKMRRLGVKGVKFLDGNSRKHGNGAYNYVVFSDKDLRMVGDASALSKSPHERMTFDAGNGDKAVVDFKRRTDGPDGAVYKVSMGRQSGEGKAYDFNSLTVPQVRELFERTRDTLFDHARKYDGLEYQFRPTLSDAHKRFFANQVERTEPPAGYKWVVEPDEKATTFKLVRDPARKTLTPSTPKPPGQNGLVGMKLSKAKGPKLAPRVIDTLNTVGKGIPPDVREKLGVNGLLPPGQRRSAIEASGYDPSVFALAKPFQGRHAVDAGIESAKRDLGKVGRPPNLAPLASVERQAMNNRKSAQRSLNTAERKGTATEGHRNRQRAALADEQEAKRKLEAGKLAVISHAEVLDQVNRRLAAINRELETAPPSMPTRKPVLRTPLGGQRGQKFKGGANTEANDAAKLLFSEEYADRLPKLLSGEEIPRPRSNDHLFLSIAAAGGLSAVLGWGLMTSEAKKGATERGIANGTIPEPVEPPDPRYRDDPEANSKDWRTVKAAQFNLNLIDQRFHLSPDGHMIRADGKETNTQQVVKRFQWEHREDYGLEVTGLLDEKTIAAISEEARKVPLNRAGNAGARRETAPAQ